MKTHKKWILFIVIALFLGAIFYFVKNKSANKPLQVVKQFTKSEKQAPTLFPAINGSLVEPAVAQKRPVAIMVENHPDARPQSGLVDADLVYEALAEGGITRFMAVYQTKASANIGPVRSARTYYAELADELGAVYAHVGGNSDALANIKANQYPRISNADQFFLDSFFHRIAARKMPHNVYTSTDKMQQLIVNQKFSNTATYTNWLFKDDGKANTTDVLAKKISINFSYPKFKVVWQYDAAANLYYRYMAGAPHKDLDSGKQITAKNIIVQSVNIFPVQSDTPLSIGMNLDEGGKAKIFLDGKVIEGTWAKKDGRTRYFDSSGTEIPFDRGTTWVEIVPQELFAQVTWQ